MTEKLRNLIEQKNKLVTDMRVILDKAEEEKRSLTSEEDATYATMETDLDKALNDIKAEEKSEERAKKLAMIEGASADPNRALANQDADVSQEAQRTQPSPEEIRSKLAKGWEVRNELVLGGIRSTTEYEQAFLEYLALGNSMTQESRNILVPGDVDTREGRALQADIDTSGGYLVVPEQFIARLIAKLDNLVFMRRYCTVIPTTNAASVGVPVLDNDPADPTWTAELNIGAADTTMDFEKRALTPHPLAQYIKVSKKLLRVAVLSVDAIVRDRLGYKFAVVEENAYLNGHGSNQPLGVFVANNAGISSASARNISTGNTTTAIKADNLIEVKYGLKAQYRTRARWIFHRTALKMIRKLKDGEGNYLWRPGIATDRPDTILDLPFDESEYCPSTFTTGKYVGILGDFSFYWIVDAMNMNVQVLLERFADTNQNAYIGRRELDASPVVEEAFIRCTLA